MRPPWEAPRRPRGRREGQRRMTRKHFRAGPPPFRPATPATSRRPGATMASQRRWARHQLRTRRPRSEATGRPLEIRSTITKAARGVVPPAAGHGPQRPRRPPQRATCSKRSPECRTTSARPNVASHPGFCEATTASSSSAWRGSATSTSSVTTASTAEARSRSSWTRRPTSASSCGSTLSTRPTSACLCPSARRRPSGTAATPSGTASRSAGCGSRTTGGSTCASSGWTDAIAHCSRCTCPLLEGTTTSTRRFRRRTTTRALTTVVGYASIWTSCCVTAPPPKKSSECARATRSR